MRNNLRVGKAVRSGKAVVYPILNGSTEIGYLRREPKQPLYIYLHGGYIGVAHGKGSTGKEEALQMVRRRLKDG